MKISYLAFLLLPLSFQVFACENKELSFDKASKNPQNKISGPFSIEKLENENMIEIRQTHKVLPFGYANDDWVKFKSKIKPKDKIYFLKHSDKRFNIDGHVLVRQGCIIEFLKGAIS